MELEMNELRELVRKKIDEIYANREEILTAFIAKYGCHPDEIEQVCQIEGMETRWYIRFREKTFDECIDDIDNLAEKLRND